MSDPEFTGVIAVALPEEMPVNETLEYSEQIEEFRGPLDAVVVYGLYPERFTDDEVASLNGHGGPAVRAALTEHHRYRAQQEELARLRQGIDGMPLVELPFLFAPELRIDEVEELSHALEEQLT